MNDLVLVVTRDGENEWDTIWGFTAPPDTLRRYDESGGVIPPGRDEAPVLMIMNGKKLNVLKTFKQDIHAVIKNMKVYSVVHGENENIQNLFNLSPAMYGLGNSNIPPVGSLGDFVVQLATTIKENKGKEEFQKNLEALKSAIRGDRLSKAMGSFLTTLSPLSLIQDQRIKDGVCGGLANLDDAARSDLHTIFTDMGKELLGLADYIQEKNHGEVVEWALQNDSMLKSLARGYL